MLQPRKEKYRKKFRGKMRGKSQRANKVTTGEYGLKAVTRGWVSSNQLESARKSIAHYTKRKGKLWVRIFPDKSYTTKPAEVKMGGGKGDIAGYVAVVKPGRIIFELSGIEESVAKEALRRAGHKVTIKTKFVKK
ncbi:50S ribosomal protein L16 [Candidatus Dojkabacteria bacterium]|nr:50S ribosomal protein L16 [Candidatus Dojkabacteria bacterium]